jgi:hypothetical protein
LWKTSLLLPALALATACHDAPARRATGPRETPVMRVVYRDAHDRMLLTFRAMATRRSPLAWWTMNATRPC